MICFKIFFLFCKTKGTEMHGGTEHYGAAPVTTRLSELAALGEALTVLHQSLTAPQSTESSR